MILAMMLSTISWVISRTHSELFQLFCTKISNIDFKAFVFDFLLGVLLFAGSIHVDTKAILKNKTTIFQFATIGVLLSSIIIGFLVYYISSWFGLSISLPYALVFGALISPTDPVAVLALLNKAGIRKELEIKIIGESLFNDGIGIILFLAILPFTKMGVSEINFHVLSIELLKEIFGGIILGFLIAALSIKVFRTIKKEGILMTHISLAITLAGYSIAMRIGFSGAITMVVSGLILGHYLHSQTNSSENPKQISIFWKTLDEILNSVLFVLLGIEVISVQFNINVLLLSLIVIPLIILSRFISLSLGNLFSPTDIKSNRLDLALLSWAGLRGAISLGLVFTLPDSETRDLLLMLTYIIVTFSIIVQGLSLGKVYKYLNSIN